MAHLYHLSQLWRLKVALQAVVQDVDALYRGMFLMPRMLRLDNGISDNGEVLSNQRERW